MNVKRALALALVLALLCAVPALASDLKKEAVLDYLNIRITLDGEELRPTDAAGSYVEPFVIDGTTYLPVRGIASALGLDVSWDGASSTVVLTTPEKEKTVYITRTGSRYHDDAHCNGGVYWPVPLETAVGLGLEPCEKCAGGTPADPEAQSSLAQRLTDYGDLFTSVTSSYTGETFIRSMADLDQQAERIRQYGETIAALRGRSIGDGLLRRLLDLPIDDGLALAERLNALSDRDLADYAGAYAGAIALRESDLSDADMLAATGDSLAAYRDILAGLRDRGLPAGLMAQVRKLDLSPGLAYGGKLLSLSDGDWTAYMAAYARKEAAASASAEAILGP